MKLRRLHIRRLPGLDEGLAFDELAPGLNLVHGPNGSGKTSLCRALRALLWPELDEVASPTLEAAFDEADAALLARRDGRAPTSWQSAGLDVAPPHLPEAHLAHCYTISAPELLQFDQARSDAEVAAAMRRQLAGGFDFEELERGSLHVGARHGQTERGRLEEAKKDEAEKRRAQRALADQENALAELELRRDAARDAAKRTVVLENKLALHAAEDELAAHERLLETRYPAALRELSGGESDALARLDEEGRELDELRGTAVAARRAAEAELESVRMAGEPAQDPSALLESAQAHVELDEERRRVAGERAGGDGALAELAARLGAVEPERVPSPEAIDEAARAIEEHAALRAREEQLRERLASHGEVDADAPERAERLERGQRELDAGLDEAEPAPTRGPWIAVALAVVVAVAGAWSFTSSPWLGAGLLGAGVLGAGLAVGLESGARRRRRASEERRAHARKRYLELGLEAPESWERGAVRARQRQSAAAIDTLRRAGHAAERRAADERALAELEGAVSALEVRVAELASEHGLGPRLGALTLASLLGDLREHGRLVREREGLLARESALEAEAAALRASLVTPLERGGLTVPAEARALRAALVSWADRQRRWREAAERVRDTAEALTALEARGKEHAARVAELAARVGVEADERMELERRIALLPSWREDLATLHTLRGKVEERRAALPDGDSVLDDADLLRTELAAARATAGELSALEESLTSTRTLIAKAREGHTLERALAATATARAELETCLETELDRAAGSFLLARARQQQEKESLPRLVQEAARLFARFTGQRYELTLASEGAGLSAIDRDTGHGVPLAALSDGTRSQLLLAARLAYAFESERGSAVPLILDEALTATDPARFRAVATALVELVREGRQVFYLTCDPADLRHWQAVLEEAGEPEAQVIDLGAMRGAAAVAGAEYTEAIAEAPLDAEALGPAEWARRAEVPRLDPADGALSVALYWLVPELAPALETLRPYGVTTLGRLRAERALVEGLIGAAPTRDLERAGRAFEALLSAWKRGRGRPVDRAVLEASGAVSDIFLDRVSELAEELGGDAARLVAALGSKEVSGFRASKVAELEAFLRAEGHLDSQPVRTRSELAGLALRALGPTEGAGQDRLQGRVVAWLDLLAVSD